MNTNTHPDAATAASQTSLFKTYPSEEVRQSHFNTAMDAQKPHVSSSRYPMIHWMALCSSE